MLQKLSEKFFKNSDDTKSNLDADIVGLSLIEIDTLLKIDKNTRELILSELEKADEIVFYNLGEKGCFIEPKNGLSALTSKKYIKQNQDIILTWSRNFVQIFIPVASLLIAFIALSLNISKTKIENSEEINKLELKIEHLDSLYNALKIKTDTIRK